MEQEEIQDLFEILRSLSRNTRFISHGETEPMGFEALVMALSGPGTPGEQNIASGLHAIADSLSDVADAIRTHSDA